MYEMNEIVRDEKALRKVAKELVNAIVRNAMVALERESDEGGQSSPEWKVREKKVRKMSSSSQFSPVKWTC